MTKTSHHKTTPTQSRTVFTTSTHIRDCINHNSHELIHKLTGKSNGVHTQHHRHGVHTQPKSQDTSEEKVKQVHMKIKTLIITKYNMLVNCNLHQL